MALAIAEKLTGQTGLSVIAIHHGVDHRAAQSDQCGDHGLVLRREPWLENLCLQDHHQSIIIGALLGVLVNLSGMPVYAPVMTAIDLIASASLGLGLVTVGAGLRVADALKPQPSVLLTVVLKLLVFRSWPFSCPHLRLSARSS